jgi:PAS domain S-box-containing protein
MSVPIPSNEADRIRALSTYGILDSLPEAGFDDLVQLAARICQTPIALISLVDSDRQWFKSRIGMAVGETPREAAFCAHGIVSSEELFIVPDALKDPRFAQSPLVQGEPRVRFYTGARLVNAEGFALGMLCVMGHQPRVLDEFQKDSLQKLARQVMSQLELRRELAAHKTSRERHSLVIDNLKEIVFQTDAGGLWTFLNPAWEEITGFTLTESLGTLFLDYVHPDDRARNQELFKPLIERKKQYCRHEVRYLTKAGGYKWIEVFARLTLDSKDTIVGTSGTLHDVTERRTVEERLRESEALYHSLVEHLPLFILRKDTAGRFTFANKSLCEILRCSPQDVAGKTDFDFLPAPTAEKFRAIDQHALATGEVTDVVETLPRADGEIAHVQIITVPVRDLAGKMAGVQVISRDVTEKHRFEVELRKAHDESEQRVRERTAQLEAANISLTKAEQQAQEWKKRYDLVVASTGLAVYDIDRVTGEVVWGNGADQVLCQPAAALHRADEKFLDSIHPEDREDLARAIGHAITAGFSYDVQYRLCYAKERYLWIEDRGFFVRDAQGRCLRVLGAMQNVTERKLAEDKMREQSALLDKTQDAIMVRDLEDRIVYWNQTSEQLYGWKVHEVIGRPVHEILLRGRLAHMPVGRAIALRNGEWSGEVKVFSKSGKELIVNSRWTVLHDRAGKPRAFLVAHTDLTERKLLEEKFFRAQRMENIGALASGIAHDLNNVFTPILMAAQLLQREMDEAARANMIGLLQTSARRGSDMVKQVLTFTRGVNAGLGVVQVKHLVGELEKMMRDTFPPNIKIHTSVGHHLSPVRGDITQLYQILLNLCVNARDAMPGGGTLTIEGNNVDLTPEQAASHPGKRGPHVCLTVSDTGTGMPPELVGKVFEPFFTTKEAGKGTGLGLSTVKQLVEAHCGFIELHSEAGAGARFNIFLPADTSEKDETAVSVAEPPSGNGELLLVVEDESAIREIVKSTLEAHNYDVLLAEEGTEAIALYAARRNKIALVITDLAMPVMDGRATIRALRKMNPDVKLIAVSGLMDAGALAQMAEITGTKVLSKPYSPRKLLTAIHEAIH